MKTILVAVSGMSPAIVTETVWALADRSEPVVPDEVVVITTARGEEDIGTQLLKPPPERGKSSVWENLRKSVFSKAGLAEKCDKLQLSMRVIEIPDPVGGLKTKAQDLRTDEDNKEAADFFLRTVSPLAEPADHHVIASIAGGRKTMGALLYGAMSLVAKETDLVTHVLVNEPFETTRGFFYPEQPEQDLQAFDPLTKTTRPVRARDAWIELAIIPFVPLRNGFRELNEKSLSFGGLVERYTRELKRPLESPPRLGLDANSSKIILEDVEIALTGRELLVATFLYLKAKEGKNLFQSQKQAIPPYLKFVQKWKNDYPSHPAVARISQQPQCDDLAKGLSSLRKKLLAKGLGRAVPYLVPERSRVGFDAEIL